MPWTNYHTHSHFSDGSSAPEDYVISAMEKGFPALGFSEHSPVPFENSWSCQPDSAPEYLAEIQRLKETYAGRIQIYMGLEQDYIPFVTRDFDELTKECGLEYCIGSVHFARNPKNQKLWFIDGPRSVFIDGIADIFGGNLEEGIFMYYNQINLMIHSQKPDVIGHLDKVKMHNKGDLFQETDEFYRKAVFRTLDVVKREHSIVEVNTRGWYTGKAEDWYPSDWILEEMFQRKIPITLSSDAHDPSNLDSGFPEVARVLLDIGYREVRIFYDRKWQPAELTGDGIILPQSG